MNARNELWQHLLSDKRFGDQEPAQVGEEQTRSPFDRDYDRLVYSSAFRRLQDKTQVFPLSKTDYTRTRLTHSLEVSCVGRALGAAAGKYLKFKQGIPSLDPQQTGTIVATACLAHDLGNPPFGHSGEDAIREWARQRVRQKQTRDAKVEKCLVELESANEIQDLYQFEGNAQNFRIATRMFPQLGSLAFTFAVLGAMTKYPCPSVFPNRCKRNLNNVSEKKFGYFTSESKEAISIFSALGMKEKVRGVFSRHPLSFLTEAADDICYSIIDLEDSFKLRFIDYQKVEELLLPLAERDQRIKTNKHCLHKLPEDVRVSKLRAAAISVLTEQCLQEFKNRLGEIEEGKLEHSLVSLCDTAKDYRALRNHMKSKVYLEFDVVQIEATGFCVIQGLLDRFSRALVVKRDSKEDLKVRQLFPSQYLTARPEQSLRSINALVEGLNHYERLMAVTDYVSGMTDTFAVELFQKLSGIRIADH